PQRASWLNSLMVSALLKLIGIHIMKGINLNLEEFLKQQSVVAETIPSPEKIVQTVKERIASGRSINIMYGETYDRYGCALESIKYYFVVSAIGKVICSEYGGVVKPTILVADIATC